MPDFLTAIAATVRRAARHILWDHSEHCVCELMAKLESTPSRMSRHMKPMKPAGIVVGRRDAQWVRYRKNPALSRELSIIIDAVLNAEQLNERNVA